MDREEKATLPEQDFYRLKNSRTPEQLQELTQYLLGLDYDREELAKQQAETEFITIDDVAKAKEEAKNFGKPKGLLSGFWEIDRMVAGFAPGEITVIGGGTSMGKSLLAANILAQQLMMGHKTVFVTLETLKNQFVERLIQIMGEEQLNWCVLNKLLKVQKETRLDWQSIRYLARDVVQDYGAEILYIDHLHYFAQGENDDPGTIGQITQAFCDVAKENKIPIVLLSQLKRTIEREHRPSIQDFKGGSYIEQNADVALSVWQTKREIPQSHIWVGIEKNRNRPIWKPEIAETMFYRDGLKMLKTEYSYELDAQFNETKRFLKEYEKACQMGLI